MMRDGLLCAMAMFWLSMGAGAQAALPNAHSHNDYVHERPLLDALDLGFLSVEADIYLVDGALLVAHDLAQCSPERSLQGLYLDPLFARFLAHKGHIYDSPDGFTLLVDVKSAERATYQALRPLLASYAQRPNGKGFLTRTVRGTTEPGAVAVIVSGGVVPADVEAEWERYVGIDGRSTDLGSPRPASVMPLISERWGQLFTWDGRGAIPADERAKLKSLVDQAHAKGRRVRFWATPERPALWGELLRAGVDLINTDDIAGLAAFLRARP